MSRTVDRASVRTGRFRRSAPLPLVIADSNEQSAAACLASVLLWMGRPTTLAETQERMASPGAAGDLLTLVEAGRSFGLEMVQLDADLSNLDDVPQPAILQWSTRYVVLERRHHRRWTILDPTWGRRRMTDTELSAHFGGAVLTTNPGPGFYSQRGRRRGRASGWRTLLRQVSSAPDLPALLTGVGVLSVLLLATGLVFPVVTKVLVDEVLPQRVPGVVQLVGVGLGMLMTTRFLAAYLRGRLLVVVQGHLDNRLMTSLFAHMVALPFRFFQERSTGDLVQRFSSNALIRNALTQQTISGLVDTLMIVVYAGALFWVSPLFGAVAVGLGLAQVAALVLPARRNRRLTREELESVARTQSFAVEVVTGAAYIKASGSEGGLLASWARHLGQQLDASMRRRRFNALLSAASSTIATSSSVLLLLLGVALVLAGRMSLGTAFALTALSGSFLAPVATLVASLQALQGVQGHVERLNEVLVQEPEQVGAARPPLTALQGRVELRDVGFRYRTGGDGPWAVRHVSFSMEPGCRVAVVGTSGSGKSTLARIVLGLHVPEEGTVLVDGRPLHEHDLGSFRRQCGVVLQEPVVFDGSVSDNVAFYDTEVTQEDVARAVRLAALEADVAAMPQGLDTLIGERGTGLSGGQRQRLALARALVHRPALLVLDEATGALDTVTEAAVNRSLAEEECSVLVIAHRLSTVREADCIIVLEGGRIAEMGTHAQLARCGGRYASLVAADEREVQALALLE